MKRILLYSLYGLIGLGVISVFAFVTLQPIKVLPRIRLSPGYSLKDQDGKRLTNEDLRGSIVLYNFTYSGCQAPCPQTGETMLEIQNRVKHMDLQGIPVKLVTISFDTQNDTPAARKGYLAKMNADESTWKFAAGDDPQLLKTIIGAGFEVYYQPEPAGGFEFDPTYVLVDGWGIIRGEYTYQTLTPNVERIVRHIGVLIDEVQNSVGTSRYAYEAAHLFLCYAP